MTSAATTAAKTRQCIEKLYYRSLLHNSNSLSASNNTLINTTKISSSLSFLPGGDDANTDDNVHRHSYGMLTNVQQQQQKGRNYSLISPHIHNHEQKRKLHTTPARMSSDSVNSGKNGNESNDDVIIRFSNGKNSRTSTPPHQQQQQQTQNINKDDIAYHISSTQKILSSQQTPKLSSSKPLLRLVERELDYWAYRHPRYSSRRGRIKHLQVEDYIWCIYQRLLQEEEEGKGHRIITDAMYTSIIDGLSKSNSADYALRAGHVLDTFLHLYYSSNVNNDDSERYYAKNNHYDFRPNTVLLSSVIHAYATHGEPHKAESLLRFMLKQQHQHGDDKKKALRIKPNEYSFTSVIHGYSKQVGNGKKAKEILLEWMDLYQKEKEEEEKEQGCENIARLQPPGVRAYNAVLQALAKSAAITTTRTTTTERDNSGEVHGVDAAKEAEALFRQMTMNYNNENNSECTDKDSTTLIPAAKPDAASIASLLMAWSNIPNRASGVKRAEQILIELESTEEDDDNNRVRGEKQRIIRPNAICYNIVIAAYSKMGDPTGAERILKRLLMRYEEEQQSVYYFGTNETRGKMEERQQQQQQQQLIPDVQGFNSVLNAWAKTSSVEGGQKAESLLKVMEKLGGNSGSSSMQPDVVSFNTVLDAWARAAAAVSKRKDDSGISSLSCAERAESLLRRMERGHTDDDVNNNAVDDDNNFQTEDSITRSIPSPDRVSYNTVIAAWANESAAQGAILRRQRQHQRKGMHSKNDDNEHNYHNSDCGISSLSAAERAEALLDRMRSRGIEPDVVGYNAVISAWSRSGEGERSARRSEFILASIERNEGIIGRKHRQQQQHHEGKEPYKSVRPNTVSYSSVIDAWSKSGASDGPRNAEAVLRKMESLRDKGDIHASPNIIAYNSVINAWSKSGEKGAAERAESILRRLEKGDRIAASSSSSSMPVHEIDEMRRTKQPQLSYPSLPQPNSITYCSVINAWAFDRHAKDKAVRARSVLEKMMEQVLFDEAPTTVHSRAKEGRINARRSQEMLRNAHNMVLVACARLPPNAGQSHRREALQILTKTYDDTTTGRGSKPSNLFKPDDVTFGNMIRAIGRLGKKSSEVDVDALIEQTYRDCKKVGMVTDLVWRNLKKEASFALYSKLSIEEKHYDGSNTV